MPAVSILIVEDVVQLAEIVQELLEAEGYGVSRVHTFEDALSAISTRQFDLLITDANLGAISGVELIRRSRNIAAGMKSVLMSGQPIAPSLNRDPDFRCTRFLEKPFTPSDLYKCIRELLATGCR